jgi:hypothetical protein
MICRRCVGRCRYSCFHGQLSHIFLKILVVIMTESFLSRDERCMTTDARAHNVGSSVILILSLDNLFMDLPCLLCLNHCVPVHSSSVLGFGSRYHFQGRIQSLYSVQSPRGWNRKRLPSASIRRKSLYVFHQDLGGLC